MSCTFWTVYKPRLDNLSEIFFVFLNAGEVWFTCTWQCYET